MKMFYIPSLSSRTMVYKGMLLADQVGSITRPRMSDIVSLGAGASAFFHQHLPDLGSGASVPPGRAQRRDQHAARQHQLDGGTPLCDVVKLLGDDLDKLWPLIAEGQSDTACFDNALELLVAGGYSLAHAMMLLIPEAWAGNPLMDEQRRAFYEYHAALMEPWDGPAAVAFTDGRQIGATLDRNGLRPARYLITDDDLVVMASEMGVLDIPQTQDRQEVAPAAGQDVPDRPASGPHHRRRRIEGAARRRSRITNGWTSTLDSSGEPAGRRRRQYRCAAPAAESPAGLRLLPGRHQIHSHADGDGR